MVMGLAIFTPLAIAGAIYYIAHHMIVKTALFLFEGAAKRVTGFSDLKQMGGLLKTHPVSLGCFLLRQYHLQEFRHLVVFSVSLQLYWPVLRKVNM